MDGIEIGTKVTVVDASKCKIYMRNFGEFFNDQVENADLIVLSRTGMIDEAKTLAAAELLRTLNAECGLITTPWDAVSGEQIKAAMEENGLKRAMEELAHEHHHHHDDDEEEECECCHHHHHDDDEETMKKRSTSTITTIMTTMTMSTIITTITMRTRSLIPSAWRRRANIPRMRFLPFWMPSVMKRSTALC